MFAISRFSLNKNAAVWPMTRNPIKLQKSSRIDGVINRGTKFNLKFISRAKQCLRNDWKYLPALKKASLKLPELKWKTIKPCFMAGSEMAAREKCMALKRRMCYWKYKHIGHAIKRELLMIIIIQCLPFHSAKQIQFNVNFEKLSSSYHFTMAQQKKKMRVRSCW